MLIMSRRGFDPQSQMDLFGMLRTDLELGRMLGKLDWFPAW